MTTPGPLYVVGVLAALVAAVWRPRRRPWREAADGLLFTGAGFGLILGSVATSMFDYRYSVPAALLIPVGLAIAGTRLVALARRPAAAPPAAPEEPAPERSDLDDETPAAARP
jgi:MFS family permease